MSELYLSIVIPAYNEAERILPTLETAKSFLSKQSYSAEVIIADDCSTDGTHKIAADFCARNKNFSLIRNERNLGKGAATKKGMLRARGMHRLFTDADLSTPLEELHKFFAVIENEKYDVVIGSRRVRGAQLLKRQPFHREASGRVFSVLVRLLTLRGFLDTQCGFKLFTAKAAQEIFSRLTINRFGFDVEALFLANELGFKVKEAPVKWMDSPKSHVRLWRDAGRMFMDLFTIRLNQLCGVYKRVASSIVC